MSQFEQENDLGRGGGEVDDETAQQAWESRDERLGRDDDPADESPRVDEEVERSS